MNLSFFKPASLLHATVRSSQWIRRPRTVLIGAATVAALGFAAPASAADLQNFEFKAAKTGTAPFDADNSNGNDQNDSNEFVRTYDTITYQWDYTANNGDATNTVLTATLSSDQEWEAVPAACLSAGSGIVINPDNTQTLTCAIGTVSNASTGFIQATARILGQRPDSTYVGDGDIVTGNASITSDSVTFDPALHTDSDTTEVSATPKSDLRKNAAFVVGQRVGQDGSTPGIVVRYPINVIIGGGKGSEPLNGDINVIDTVLYDDDNNTATPPVPLTDAELYNWTHPGCGWMGQYPESFYGSRPYGRYVPPTGNATYSNATRSVMNSGDWTCTQAAPGDPINFNITGANTSGTTTPTRSYNNRAIPANEKYLISGSMEIWIPVQSVLDKGGEIRLTNQIGALTTPGVSGQPNVEPTLNNNEYTFTLLAGTGAFNQYYTRYLTRSGVLAPMAALNAGDGVVMPTQDFSKRLYGQNRGVLVWENYRYCEKFDNQVLALKPLAGDPTTAVAEFNNNNYGYVIEYGTGDENGNAGTYSSYDAMRLATCNDAESADGWFTDMTQVPGGPDAITKIRFRATEDVPSNATMDLRVDFTARNFYPGTTNKIPVGTLLPNFSAYSTPTITASQNTNSVARNGWYVGSYVPATHAGTKAFGDRLRLTRAIVRVEKETVPNDNVNSVLAGETVDFSLNPSITATIDPAPLSPTVTLRDVLPPEMSYVSGSANTPPTSVTPQPDGTTIIEWNLGTRVPNEPVDPITFTALVGVDVLNNTDAINTVIVESPDDGSSESERTDIRTVTIGNSAAFGISKAVVEEIIDPNEDITYILTYANTGVIDVPSATFIDVLPYLGDGRTPATDFSGSLIYDTISGTNGETFEFTNTPPASINPDPNDASNQPSGSTVWCAEASFGTGGGCPANKADVTGIRINAPLFPKNTPSRDITLTINTQGNTQEDEYTNVFGGRAVGFLGLLESPAVPTQVRIPPDVVLVKRITAVNGDRTQNPNDGTPLNQVIDDTTPPYADDDSHPNWPAGYLVGALDGGKVSTGDEIEYTVYFHNIGGTNAEQVRLCDVIQDNQSLVLGAYGANNDIQFQLQGASTQDLTAAADGGDRGEFVGPGLPIPANCNSSLPNNNGVVKVDVTGTTGLPVLPSLPGSEAINTPSPAYGWFRFKTKVN